jgi:hypothetical protein
MVSIAEPLPSSEGYAAKASKLFASGGGCTHAGNPRSTPNACRPDAGGIYTRSTLEGSFWGFARRSHSEGGSKPLATI